MKKQILLKIFSVVFCGALWGQQKEKESNNLWYSQPAAKWMEALPVGNGRLGAMVFGDPLHERIQLNEDSMWPGSGDWGDGKGNGDDLQEIRSLLNEGKTKEVDSLVVEKFSYKSVLRSHQTMGDLYIDFDSNGKVENYKRWLSLDDAIAESNYTLSGYKYSQKVIASHPDDVLVIRLETNNPKGMSFNLRMGRPLDKGHQTATVSTISQNEISMLGEVTQYGGKKFSEPSPITHGVRFESRVKVNAIAGVVSSSGGEISVKGAKEVLIYLVAATSFYHDDGFQQKNTETLSRISSTTFDVLFNKHKTDYQTLYNRMQFELGDKALDSLPINERIKRVKSGLQDNDLEAKLFQFGRYLLIASSRVGANPANLQGLWNEHIEAPWNADYHLNINLQMNYWPAEVTNLSELHNPFFNLLDRVYKRGETTAREQYGMQRGTMSHHATDLWAAPFMRGARAYWGASVHGGAWCAQHFWEHYQFTQDKAFLRERAYPVFENLAAFYLDWLVWDEKSKKWVSSPETSPENSYYNAKGESAAISFGSAMGHQIIGEVFDNLLATAKILEINTAFIKEVAEKRKKLHPGVIVGDDGRILEWNEPYDEPEKGHRHMSHLYSLFPGDDILADNTKAFNAAQKTINYRLEHGGAGTGWSRVWMISMNARLLDGISAQENIDKFLQLSLANNMFGQHPPFQIDGNFGYTAGVAETLVQSHEGFLRILPALPIHWKNGDIKGLKARGNIEVDILWKAGKLEQLTLKSKESRKVKVKYDAIFKEISLPKNTPIVLSSSLEIIK